MSWVAVWCVLWADVDSFSAWAVKTAQSGRFQLDGPAGRGHGTDHPRIHWGRDRCLHTWRVHRTARGVIELLLLIVRRYCHDADGEQSDNYEQDPFP
jgi:hypothetical protein